MPKDKLVIFDTTLRDGEQSPGASMTKDEKVRIAKIDHSRDLPRLECSERIENVWALFECPGRHPAEVPAPVTGRDVFRILSGHLCEGRRFSVL